MAHPKIRLPESAVERQVVEGLVAFGYEVLKTSHRHRRIECVCGAKLRPGSYGADYGVPDLLVRRDGWPIGAWIGLELKGTATPLSARQQELAAAGAIIVVRSFQDALEGIARAMVGFAK